MRPRLKPLSTIKEEGDEDQIWTPDLEQAFEEAVSLVPDGKRKIKFEGKVYGRNSLIALFIERRTGKSRTNNQIASHLQVWNQRKVNPKFQKIVIQKNLYSNGLIAPTIYNNELLGLTENGVVKFLRLKEDHNTEQYFTDIVTFISNIFELLKYRRISGEKIAFLAIVIYVHEPNPYSNFLYSNNLTRGYTCLTDKVIPDIQLSKIQHYFGQDLVKLFSIAPQSAFYCVKTWNNFYYSSDPNAYIIWDTIFYSKFLMNVRDESICYLMGQQLYGGIVEMEVDELTVDSEKYYIYKARCSPNCCGSSIIQQTYLQNVKRIVDAGDVELLKVIVRNQSRLIILTDAGTNEIYMVLACINDYEPDFTGYQYFKIVP